MHLVTDAARQRALKKSLRAFGPTIEPIETCRVIIEAASLRCASVYRMFYDGTSFWIIRTEQGQSILLDEAEVCSQDRPNVDFAKERLKSDWEFRVRELQAESKW